MFDREDVNEKVLSMDKDYILNNVMLTMENIDGYLPIIRNTFHLRSSTVVDGLL